MSINKLRVLNRVSGISFLISSVSLIIISLIKIDDNIPRLAYFFAAMFWLGLPVGICFQIFLSIKLKKLETGSVQKNRKIFYIVSLAASLLFIILVAANVNIIFLVMLSLAAAIFSIEAAVVLKKEEALK